MTTNVVMSAAILLLLESFTKTLHSREYRGYDITAMAAPSIIGVKNGKNMKMAAMIAHSSRMKKKYDDMREFISNNLTH
jgi:hypothetical protein